jgi:hypothetical protein
MTKKHITGRQLRHESPEESLSPGESVEVRKRGGKVFELRRIDAGGKDILEGLDNLLLEMPAAGPACRVDLSKIIVEDRE